MSTSGFRRNYLILLLQLFLEYGWCIVNSRRTRSSATNEKNKIIKIHVMDKPLSFNFFLEDNPKSD